MINYDKGKTGTRNDIIYAWLIGTVHKREVGGGPIQKNQHPPLIDRNIFRAPCPPPPRKIGVNPTDSTSGVKLVWLFQPPLFFFRPPKLQEASLLHKRLPLISVCKRSPMNSVIYVHHARGGGGTQYKRLYGDVPPTWVAKSASWYLNDPLKTQNLVYEWVDF